MTQEEMKNLKKIDLHCHLDGSLSEETIQKMAQNNGILLPEREELFQRLCAGDDCQDLKEYLDCFEIPLSLLQTEENLEEAVRSLLKDAAKENTLYMEIRFAPLSSVSGGLSCEQVIAAAVNGLKKGRKESGVEGNLILCAMRHTDPAENLEILKAGEKFLGEGVCGVDAAGNEAAFPITGQKRFFEEAKYQGFPFTIHAGECGSAESIRDALALGASRIGHGIAARKDPELIKELRERQIPLEMCPISNLQTKAAKSAAEYPFREFLGAGLCVTINTDNRMVSGTSMTRELSWLSKEFRLTKEEAEGLMRNAAKAAFAPEEIKKRLVQEI